MTNNSLKSGKEAKKERKRRKKAAQAIRRINIAKRQVEELQLAMKIERVRHNLCLDVNRATAVAVFEKLKDLVGVFKIDHFYTNDEKQAEELLEKRKGYMPYWYQTARGLEVAVKDYARRFTIKQIPMFEMHAEYGLEVMKAALEGIDEGMEELERKESEEYREYLKRKELAKEFNEEYVKPTFIKPKVYATTVLSHFDLSRDLEEIIRRSHPLTQKRIKGLPKEAYSIEGIDPERFYEIDLIANQVEERDIRGKGKGELTMIDRDNVSLVQEWEEKIPFVIERLNLTNLIIKRVLKQAKVAEEAGLAGIVCPSWVLNHIRPKLREDFEYITPGFKPPIAGKPEYDMISPSDAIEKGSSLLVLRSTITDIADPEKGREAVYKILKEMTYTL